MSVVVVVVSILPHDLITWNSVDGIPEINIQNTHTTKQQQYQKNHIIKIIIYALKQVHCQFVNILPALSLFFYVTKYQNIKISEYKKQ